MGHVLYAGCSSPRPPRCCCCVGAMYIHFCWASGWCGPTSTSSPSTLRSSCPSEPTQIRPLEVSSTRARRRADLAWQGRHIDERRREWVCGVVVDERLLRMRPYAHPSGSGRPRAGGLRASLASFGSFLRRLLQKPARGESRALEVENRVFRKSSRGFGWLRLWRALKPPSRAAPHHSERRWAVVWRRERERELSEQEEPPKSSSLSRCVCVVKY